jgi:hypothetical protein
VVPDELLGPGALLIASLVAIGFLWRDHLRSDTDDRSERDEWRSIAVRYAEQIPALTQAVDKLTTAVREMDERRGDQTLEAVKQVQGSIDKLAARR